MSLALGISGAIWSGLGAIATLIVEGFRILINWLTEFAKWIVEHPDKGVLVGCLLWAMLAP